MKDHEISEDLLPKNYLKPGLWLLNQELRGDRYLDFTPQEAFLEGLRISNFLLKLPSFSKQ